MDAGQTDPAGGSTRRRTGSELTLLDGGRRVRGMFQLHGRHASQVAQQTDTQTHRPRYFTLLHARQVAQVNRQVATERTESASARPAYAQSQSDCTKIWKGCGESPA